jgi:hypothetical protein
MGDGPDCEKRRASAISDLHDACPIGIGSTSAVVVVDAVRASVLNPVAAVFVDPVAAVFVGSVEASVLQYVEAVLVESVEASVMQSVEASVLQSVEADSVEADSVGVGVSAGGPRKRRRILGSLTAYLRRQEAACGGVSPFAVTEAEPYKLELNKILKVLVDWLVWEENKDMVCALKSCARFVRACLLAAADEYTFRLELVYSQVRGVERVYKELLL